MSLMVDILLILFEYRIGGFFIGFMVFGVIGRFIFGFVVVFEIIIGLVFFFGILLSLCKDFFFLSWKVFGGYMYSEISFLGDTYELVRFLGVLKLKLFEVEIMFIILKLFLFLIFMICMEGLFKLLKKLFIWIFLLFGLRMKFFDSDWYIGIRLLGE